MRSKLAALVRRTPPLPTSTSTSTSSSNQTNGANGDNAKLDSDNSVIVGQTSGTSSSSSAATLRALLQKSKRGVVRGSPVEQYFRTSKIPKVYHLQPSPVPVCTTP